MNRRQSVVALVAVSAALGVHAAHGDVAGAKAVASDWLAALDRADDPASWKSASAMFQAAMSEQGWSSAAKTARQPLGALRSRSERSATTTRSLPGAPDGDDVVVQYDANFEKKANAVELLTVAKDKDGRWKVAGYFIQ